MAFCTRCGQQTDADEEFCFACGGSAPDAYSVGAYSGTASRVSSSPADSYATPDRRGWFQEPEPREFRLPRWAPDPALGPTQEPMADEPDRRLRYTQSPADAPGSAEPGNWHGSDGRYPGEPASPALSPTGRLPEFGPRAGGQDLAGHPDGPDEQSWPGRESPAEAASGQFTWAAPDPLTGPQSDPLTGPQSRPIGPDAYAGLTGPRSPYSSPAADAYAAPDPRNSPYTSPDADAYAGPDARSGPYAFTEPDRLTGPRGLYTEPEADAYPRPGEFHNSAGPAASPVSMQSGLAAAGPLGARDQSVRGDLRVNRRGQAVRDPRNLPADPPGRQGNPRSGRWITMAAATTVLVIAAAVAYVLVGHRGTAGHTPPGRSAGTAVRPSSSAATSAPVSTVSGLVTIAPAAATGPHEAAVVAFLNRYFHAINSHSYTAYQKLFSPSLRSGLSATTFSTGYGTTRDSAATLRSISVTTAGELEAAVSFTSHQQAANSPTNSTCTAWTISLYLSKSGGRYVLQTPPAGYQPVSQSCS